MFILIATIFPILASPGLKIDEVITHEVIQKQDEITVEENLHGGKVLVLSDGSTWEVAPQDLKVSGTWILPVPLKIEKSTNPSYPYRLININSNSSVLARQIASQLNLYK
ncbi:MAG: hypothetical protein H7A41_00230 [Chlamydiales bacterium]|nr:hypothetical protein [Chlamydiia bacterium]MCP5503560.1 hypothetical protein [Chlamydiales bacterium]